MQGSTALVRQRQRPIRITFYVRERGAWRTSHTLDVDPSNPSEVERVAVKYMRKRIRLFDTELNILTPQDCFEAAIIDGRNTILLIPETEIEIGPELEASVAKLLPTEDSSEEISDRSYKMGRSSKWSPNNNQLGIIVREYKERFKGRLRNKNNN